MTRQVGGTLLSARGISAWRATHPGADDVTAVLADWAERAAATLGPASLSRRMHEELESLAASLRYDVRRAGDYGLAQASPDDALVLFAVPWREPLSMSRRLLFAAREHAADWAIGFNGAALAVMDARPACPRRAALFSLEALANDVDTTRLAASLIGTGPLLQKALADAVRLSDASADDLRRGLRDGVRASVSALSQELSFVTSVNVVFRLLFVLFAEARSLVPMWNDLYRDHYSLAQMARAATVAEPRGAWAGLEAGRRLLSRGCELGSLQVTGFSGRLFSSPLRRWARSAQLDSQLDRPAAEALTSLVAIRPSRGGARHVDYGDLDVEELGSIYERVMELDPTPGDQARKVSGSFYTPRALTSFLVRRTLAPLVAHADPDRILSLRVIDPAMGSGAFLVAALRYLAEALERGLVADGTLPAGDVTEDDRRHLRRLVAQRCLYGVDLNPTAVMLARLSVWLATLCAGKPLSFLDHRLKCGNSLVGADPAMCRRPPGAGVGGPRPLLSFLDDDSLRDGARLAARLSTLPEDSPADVRRKACALVRSATALGEWRTLCDVWCAWWFLAPTARPDRREYQALAQTLTGQSGPLPKRVLARRLAATRTAVERVRTFHWPLEFPHVFAEGGFDAVLGNPPWEMLRADGGASDRSALTAFARGSGLYVHGGAGHLNLYQLFVERALALARSGGRVGLIVPWGLMADEGSRGLRAMLLDGSAIDTCARFDNREATFQAHRSLRFAALTCSTGSTTEAFELTRVPIAELDDLPASGSPGRGPVLTRAALRDLGGRARRVPDIGDAARLALALKLARAHRGLGDPSGWGATFGRELNLSDDRRAFGRLGLPVLEGKHLTPLHVQTADVRYRISRAAAARLLPRRPFERPRLAYRDVTAQTNRQTVIAAIVPAGVVTSHSLFCLSNDWDPTTQRALALLLNGRVANFLARLFVSSHLTTALMAWLPVPDRACVVEMLGSWQQADAPDALDEIIGSLYGLDAGERKLLGPDAAAVRAGAPAI